MSLARNAQANRDIHTEYLNIGLTEAQIYTIEQGLGRRYVIDRHEACEGGFGLMITDTELGDPDTVLYVDAEPVGLSLSILQNDALWHHGCYTGAAGLLMAIRTLGIVDRP